MSGDHQNKNAAGDQTRREQTKTHAEQAATRSDQAKTRTEQAETRIEQDKTRTEQSDTRTEQSDTRLEQAKTQINQARTQTEQVASNWLAAIIEFSDDAIISKTLDGIITSWNSGAEKIFGYPAHEMVGQPILRLIPPERHQEELEILAHVRRGESVRHLDTVRVRKDGSLVDVSITTSAIKDSTGKITGASKIARDISDRKLAEQQLRESETRMRLATEATAVGIWEWNVITSKIRWDAQMFRIYGIPPTKDGYVEYAAWAESVLPEDLARQETVLQDTVRRLGHSSREFRIRRKSDGECRHVQAVETVRTNDRGHAEWVVGTNLDITERKLAATALQENEQRLRGILDTMFVFVGLMNLDGKIVEVNQAPLEAAGLKREDVLGRTVAESYWFSHSPVLQAQVTQALARVAHGEISREDYLIRVAGGGQITIDTTFAPLRDASGRVTQIVGSAVDITQRKQAEEKIHQLNVELEQRVKERTAQLEAANKELEAFSYSVSHDLRAPLRAINGFAGIVLEDFGPQLPEAGRRNLERIRNGAVRMGELIDDLLAFSRLSRQSINRQKVNSASLVQIVLDELQPQREGRQIELKVGNLPVCQGDPALLKQVWVNLISNAIKYTRGREPAVIEIGCTENVEGRESRVESQSASTSTLDSRPSTVFFVRDNGAGFDMRYADKLFGVFQRLHRADEFEGTGVGLAIVQRIVHRHGGRVWADAAPGRGATFYFTLGEANL
jgi:PAS domain S-box-containing protein